MKGQVFSFGASGARLAGALLFAIPVVASCVAQEGRSTPDAGGTSGKATSGNGLGGSLIVAGTTSSTEGGAGSGSPVGPECTTSSECAVPNPYCVPALGKCVQCVSSKNCGGTGKVYCQTERYTCVHCLSDMQCPQILPYCAPDTGDCVECLSSANCGGTH